MIKINLLDWRAAPREKRRQQFMVLFVASLVAAATLIAAGLAWALDVWRWRVAFGHIGRGVQAPTLGPQHVEASGCHGVGGTEARIERGRPVEHHAADAWS